MSITIVRHCLVQKGLWVLTEKSIPSSQSHVGLVMATWACPYGIRRWDAAACSFAWMRFTLKPRVSLHCTTQMFCSSLLTGSMRKALAAHGLLVRLRMACILLPPIATEKSAAYNLAVAVAFSILMALSRPIWIMGKVSSMAKLTSIKAEINAGEGTERPQVIVSPIVDLPNINL